MMKKGPDPGGPKHVDPVDPDPDLMLTDLFGMNVPD
jgi:hypothetical protein